MSSMKLLATLSICTIAACSGKGMEDGDIELDTGNISELPGESDNTDPDTDSGSDGTTDTDDEKDPDPITATVRGTVEVELVQIVDGEREPVDTSQLSSVPYGDIFVGGYDDPDGDGSENYRGTTAVSSPDFGPNEFEMSITMTEDGEITVYAIVDENGNTVIESVEPVGVWPDPVEITDGAVITDVAIKIVAEYDPYSSGGGSGSGSGGSGEDCNLVVSGPATVGIDYEGSGIAMLVDTSGNGPLYFNIFDVAADDDASYAMTDVCAELGSVQLIGAIDSNQNNLFDPADLSGAYVTSPDTNGNPIFVDTADLTDYELQIPIISPTTGEPEDNSIEIVPFVRLSGEITYDSGTFDDLDPGSKIYVVALKYRPNTSVAASTAISNSFDYQVFDWTDLAGQSAVTYQLMVPGNAETYLWAYADTDLDGTLNEVGEPVASAGNSTGYVATGTTSATYNMIMGTP
jgi:hypothetical protein